jgi:TolB protein
VSSYHGINGAPAFSPDGGRLAITLSKDGSPDVYVLNLANRGLTRLTNGMSIDTEPSWSPDGNNIVFTSDQGGKPQLYVVSSSGGKANRITFHGDYNARGRFSADGRSLAMVTGSGGDYRIAVMDMASKTVNVLTSGRLDESPSFSPNGTMVLYAANRGGKSTLSMASTDGAMQQKLAFESGEVREPAWAP